MIRSYSVVFFFIILYVVILCLFPGCALFSFDCSPDYQFLDDELSYQESRNAVDAFCLIVESNSKEKHESFDSFGYDVTFEDAKMYAMASASIGDFVNEFRMLEYLNYPFDDELLKRADNYIEAKNLVRKGEYMNALRLFSKYPNYLDSSAFCDEMIRQGFVVFAVGDIGPSGGYVFYDKGFYSDGWRYLEAAPADLHVVNGSIPVVDSSLDECYNYVLIRRIYFGLHKSAPKFGYPVYVNGKTSMDDDCTRKEIGEGVHNTRLLVDSLDSVVYKSSTSSVPFELYAAKLCDILEFEVNGTVFNDWFLPSIDELNLMYENLHVNGIGSFWDNFYWSSSESSITAGDAFAQDFADGCQYSIGCDQDLFVRPARAF